MIVSILNSTAAYNSFNESLTTQAYSNSSELHCSNDDGLIHKEINEALDHQTCELKMITWNSKVKSLCCSSSHFETKSLFAYMYFKQAI